MKKRSIITALGVGTAASAAVVAGLVAVPAAQASTGQTTSTAASTLTASKASIPPSLQVPAGQHLVGVFDVLRGSQVYTCTNGAYTLLQPAAVLESEQQLVLHTAGPQWISVRDGSAVTGSVVAQVARAGAVPELLLKAVANRGTGLFGDVDFIQRLDTRGGVAPTGQCAAGAIQAVPYWAQYRFYAPSSDSNTDS
jgi:hypothetical protein